jgi:hypothetical protein
MTKSGTSQRLTTRPYKFIILILITIAPTVQVTKMFGPGTWEIKLWKIFISVSDFVIVFECKVQFVSRRPLNSHLMV